MNMPLAKTTTSALAAPSPAAPAAVVSLPKSSRSFVSDTLLPNLRALAVRVIPPIIMVALIFAVWQILCMKPGATLPSPSRIWADAKDLIVDPFFVAGPQDIGLGLRVLTSLQRVAIGFGLAHAPGLYLRPELMGEAVSAHSSLLHAVAYSLVITSVSSFLYGILWLRTRNLWVVAIVHAAQDWLPTLVDALRSGVVGG